MLVADKADSRIVSRKRWVMEVRTRGRILMQIRRYNLQLYPSLFRSFAIYFNKTNKLILTARDDLYMTNDIIINNNTLVLSYIT